MSADDCFGWIIHRRIAVIIIISVGIVSYSIKISIFCLAHGKFNNCS